MSELVQSQERIDKVTAALGVPVELVGPTLWWALNAPGHDVRATMQTTAARRGPAIDTISVVVGTEGVSEPLADDVAAQVARMLTVASEKDQAARDRRIEAVRAACARLEGL